METLVKSTRSRIKAIFEGNRVLLRASLSMNAILRIGIKGAAIRAKDEDEKCKNERVEISDGSVQ
jgi:hypothetical protein